MKTKKPFVITPFPSDAGIYDEKNKLEYAKQMVELVKEDKKAVMLYISVALVGIVFLLTQYNVIIDTYQNFIFIIFTIGLAFLIASAICFFIYWRYLHKCHMSIVRCIPSLDINKIKELWEGQTGMWETYKGWFNFALAFMIFGWLLQGVAFVLMHLTCYKCHI